MQIVKNSLKPVHLVWILFILLSIAIRLPGLYDISYQWRPIHTELTVYWFVREGINLLHYQTPLLGPPWQIPIEFPLFQATAAVIFKLGLGSLDFACRLTAMVYFYFTALFLYLLCKKIFSDNLTSFAILFLYLWLPFNIHYSTEPLIDYPALGFVLAYLYFILLWLDTHSSVWNVLFATICGSLAMLVKPTTMPVVVIPIIVFVLRDILVFYRNDFKSRFDFRNLLQKAWTQRSYWITLLIMAAVPLLIGVFWTHHADRIKERSIFTQWHTSGAMASWYLGTWDLRANPSVWINSLSEAEGLLLPYSLSIFALLGIFAAANVFPLSEEKIEVRLFILSVLTSLGVVLALFLSLYKQQYYYISFSASMAILGGYGVARFLQISQRKGHILSLLFVIWAILFALFNIEDYNGLRNIAISENRKLEKSIARIERLQKYIPLDNWAVVVEYDWDPSYVYRLQRKAMVISPRELGKPVCQVLENERFTLVAVADRDYERNEELLNFTFQCFKSQREVLPGVFVVTH